MELLKTILNGALGSLTMGAYWFVITNNLQKEYNKKLEQQIKK